MQMLQGFYVGWNEHQNIVEENYCTTAKHQSQRHIHGTLKRCWSSGGAKGNDTELKVAGVSGKCRLILFTWLEPNLMVPWMKIKHWEPSTWSQFINKLIKNWYRIDWFDGQGVEVTVIHTGTLGSVFFTHQQHWWREWRLAWLNQTLIEHGVNLALNLILEVGWITVSPYVNWCSTTYKWNGMVTSSLWW